MCWGFSPQVASGRPFSFSQKDIQINGHAFEARIYAENPVKNFLPETGVIEFLDLPECSSTLRVESGVKLGDEVSIYYDPMLAKLVVHGPDRSVALRRFYAALCDFNVAGVFNNIEFLKKITTIPEFIKGDVGTWFIEVTLPSFFDRNIRKLFSRSTTKTSIDRLVLFCALLGPRNVILGKAFRLQSLESLYKTLAKIYASSFRQRQ